MTVLDLTIKEVSDLINKRKISAFELTKLALTRADTLNKKTNSFITLTNDLALNTALTVDRKMRNGFTSPIAGIPFSMKDVYMVESVQTTSASNVLKNYKSQYNSTVYEKISNEAGILIGKNNQDAWGHGGSSVNTDYGKVRNPWDLERTAGGSSGGSAAAVAGRACFYSVAEDTGGSIRNPASFCNLTGIKPTYGLVSRFGVIAYGSSLDTMGPLAKTAEDCAILLNVIAGHDTKDASSSRHPKEDYQKSLSAKLSGLKIGLLEEFAGAGIDSEVLSVLDKTTEVFEKMGAKVKRLSIPILNYGHAIYYVLVFAETSSNLARYDAVRYGYGRENFTQETKRRILTGSYDLSAGYYDKYYKKAQTARSAMLESFNKAFKDVDVILYPVMPFPAFKFGDTSKKSDSYALSLYKADIFTCIANILGDPSVAFPAGFSKNGLPIGLQLMGSMYSEAQLLNIIYQYQSLTDWHKAKPVLN